jgi:hypothetical protein
LARSAPFSNNNFAPHPWSPVLCARSKSSAPACDAHSDETNTLPRSRLPSPTLQSQRTPHDCRPHHSLEKFPAARGVAYSMSKNNPASARLRLQRKASRFPYPKSHAFSSAARLSTFLMRMHRSRPACLPLSNLAAANPPQLNRSVAPPSLGHAKNPPRKPSSWPSPITALLAREFLQFLSSPLCLPQFFLHFPKEYSREVAVLRTPFAGILPEHTRPATRGCW